MVAGLSLRSVRSRSGHTSEATPSEPIQVLSMAASQIIFHPTVSLCLKFGGTTLGRDKVSSLIRFNASI